jgi:hypothetical protein
MAPSCTGWGNEAKRGQPSVSIIGAATQQRPDRRLQGPCGASARHIVDYISSDDRGVGRSAQGVVMSILGDLQAVAAKLSLQDNRPTCAFCGKGKLVLVDERPDPNFGALGVFEQTLRCDSAECGKITID